MELRVINSPVSQDEMEKIEMMVREAAPYIVQPSNIPDQYCLSDYMYVSAFESTKFHVLIDNNIATRAISLAQGYDLRESEGQREVYKLSAAVMAFFILGGFNIEPNMAVYEKASKSTHEGALDQLRSFRVADHIIPQSYVDIALGNQNKIPDEEIEKARNIIQAKAYESNESDFSKILDSWKYNYLFLLKATSLWKTDVSDVKKAESYIQWMMEEAYFSSVSFVFSLLFLAPSRMPKMVKGINSENTKKLRDGIRNAAWDCAYIKHWQRIIDKTPSSTICFLCTNDKVMKRLALSLFPKENITSEETLLGQFQEFWGEDRGKNLYLMYADSREYVSRNREKRGKHIDVALSKTDEMIVCLERELGLYQI